MKMTELYYYDPKGGKKHIKEIIIHMFGEDGEWLWCELVFDDGSSLQSHNFKGVYT
jgi:hypothetical protein